jgi:hypothetical protein
MEHNCEYVKKSVSLHDGARALAGRAIDLSQTLLAAHQDPERVERAGRKGCPAVMPEAPAAVAAVVEAGG